MIKNHYTLIGIVRVIRNRKEFQDYVECLLEDKDKAVAHTGFFNKESVIKLRTT